jgi:glycosyltransferase involved in cell wall biosynthesis
MLLSVLIPAYNERQTIAKIVAAVTTVLPAVRKEIIIVDDCSKDGTTEFLREKLDCPGREFAAVDLGGGDQITLVPAPADALGSFSLRIMYHEVNKGKGGAVRTALSVANGDVIVLQDADLEYDPADWGVMYDLIAYRKVADVVYGSRFYGKPHRSLFFHHFLANRLISFLFNALYNQTLTDIEVGYKMFTREVVRSLSLSSSDFGIEVEITAQIALARKWRIYETGISYFGRTYAEGKKINWRDGLKALWYLLKFRL